MDLFDKFMQTGRISDYLRYRNCLEEAQHDDPERFGHKGGNTGRDQQDDLYPHS